MFALPIKLNQKFTIGNLIGLKPKSCIPESISTSFHELQTFATA